MEAGASVTKSANNSVNEFGSDNSSGNIILRSANPVRNKRVIISAPDTINTEYKITLPAAKGDADQVLKIDSISDDSNVICAWGEGGGGGSALTIQEEGSSLSTAASTLNFVGSNVTATGTGATKTITISGGGGSTSDGAVILDSKTITTNTQNVELDAGTSHTDYEYFSVVCIDILGTLSGYITWQPVDTNGSLHGTAANSKWETTNLTDGDEESITQLNKLYHILGFHTLGKQHIKSKIFGLNKSDKKYSTFKNVGLHSTGNETVSQEGNTSQASSTICNKIRINNYKEDGTLGNINTGILILYGYKKTGTVSSSLIPSPTTSNIGKSLQVNSAGNAYEFIDFSITNNRIDGDLTIGEDDSEILTIASKINVNGNEKKLLDKPVAADKGKIVTVNAAGDDLQYGANFRELACNQTIVRTNKTLTDVSNENIWYDLASHNSSFTDFNTEVTINVPQNSKILINCAISCSGTSNIFVGLRLGKKVDNNVVWGESNGVTSTENDSQTDPKGLSSNNRVETWSAIRLYYTNNEEQFEAAESTPHHIDTDPTNGLSGYHNVTYFIRLRILYTLGNVVIGTPISTSNDNARMQNATMLSAVEIGSGAITSFTQEQALAGAGGTAAFTAYTSSEHPSAHQKEKIHDDTIWQDDNSWATLNNASFPHTISYEFNIPQIVTKYRIWPRMTTAATQMIKIWELRAATDKATYDSGTYTILDSQSLDSSSSVGWPTMSSITSNTTTASNHLNLANEYNLSTIGAYKYYLLYITANYTSSYTAINEWGLYGGGFTIPSQVGNAGKQLITNGTSLSWGSPASILVPSPSGNASKVLRANSAGNALEYGNDLPNVDTAFLGGLTSNLVSITTESFSHAAATGYNYTTGGIYDNYLSKSGNPNGMYFIDSGAGWSNTSTWYWQFTINESKIVNYVRLWAFEPHNYHSGKDWNLYGSNNNGSSFTLIGTHTITSYPDDTGVSAGDLASENKNLSVRLGFDNNDTSYTTYKLETTSYNSGSGRFGTREIQFGKTNSSLLYGDKFTITQEITTPSQPSHGVGHLYTKAGGLPYWRSYDINETALIENGRQFSFHATNGGGGYHFNGGSSNTYYQFPNSDSDDIDFTFTIGIVENSSQFFDVDTCEYTVPMDGNYTFGWTTTKLGHSSGSRLVIRRLRGSTYTNLVDSGYSTTSSVRYTSVSNTSLLRNDIVSFWVLGPNSASGGQETGLYIYQATSVSSSENTIIHGYKN